jgi:hypothetical protein
MTALSSIDPARFLHEQLESASPDLLRSMLVTEFAEAAGRVWLPGPRLGLSRRHLEVK